MRYRFVVVHPARGEGPLLPRGEVTCVRRTGILAKRNTPKKARKFKHLVPPSGRPRKKRMLPRDESKYGERHFHYRDAKRPTRAYRDHGGRRHGACHKAIRSEGRMRSGQLV